MWLRREIMKHDIELNWFDLDADIPGRETVTEAVL